MEYFITIYYILSSGDCVDLSLVAVFSIEKPCSLLLQLLDQRLRVQRVVFGNMKLGLLFATVASANQNDFYENGLSQIASNWKKLLDASEIKSTSRDRLNDRLDRIIAKLEDRDIKLRLVFKFISRILVMCLQNVFVI